MRTGWKHWTAATGFAWLAATGLALAIGVQGQITKTDGQVLTGTIRWLGVAKKYEITTLEKQIALEVDPQLVQAVQVTPPREIRAAAAAVQQNTNIDAAIPVLQRIADAYTMLQWDIPATRWLAEAYLKKGDAAAAVKACEKVTDIRPDAGYATELALPYWEALLKTGKTSRLTDNLDQSMSSGTPEMVARALVMRGDVLKSKGDLKLALKDGYLRAVLLLKKERAVQPEALFKAMKCFEELGQVTYAEKMRKELMSRYGNSEYARKVAGS